MKKRYLTAGLSCRVISFIVIGCLAGSLNAQHNLPDVPVSVDVKNKTIRQILQEFTLQTGYYFTYDASLIQDERKKDFKIKEVTLNKALDSLFKNPALSYRLIEKNIVFYRKNVTRPAPSELISDHALIHGRIVDKKNKMPLPYATISLLETNLGAITNQSGEFSFKIPEHINDPLLVITYIGYKNQYFPIKYPVEQTMTIEMEQDLISLQEVIIRYQDPVSIIRECISLIPENYMNDHTVMTAFYRESVSRNDHYMLLSEALLEIAKSPYNHTATDRVRIFKGRKIVDVSVEDTVLLKIRSGIYTSLNLDIIKNPPDFLSEDFMELYNFHFSDIISYGDKLVYVIQFSPKSHILETLFRGSLYIDIESLALVFADFRYDPEKIQREEGLFVVSKSRNLRIRPVSANYHVDYRQNSGKYHISQVRADVELRIRRRRAWIGSKYRIAIEMAVTNVFPGERLRIVPGERVRPNIVLSEESFKYEPEFWGAYNIIEPEKSLEEALQLINKSMLEYLVPENEEP